MVTNVIVHTSLADIQVRGLPRTSPLGSKFFHFHAVFGKKFAKNPTLGVGASSGKFWFHNEQRRLGQRNIFTSMCQEFCSGGRGGLYQHALQVVSQHALQQVSTVLSQHALQVVSQHALQQQVSKGGRVPAPRGSLLWVGLLPGGSTPGGLFQGCLVETPPPGRLLLWAVRILLECILVSNKNITILKHCQFGLKHPISTT